MYLLSINYISVYEYIYVKLTYYCSFTFRFTICYSIFPITRSFDNNLELINSYYIYILVCVCVYRYVFAYLCVCVSVCVCVCMCVRECECYLTIVNLSCKPYSSQICPVSLQIVWNRMLLAKKQYNFLLNMKKLRSRFHDQNTVVLEGCLERKAASAILLNYRI